MPDFSSEIALSFSIFGLTYRETLDISDYTPNDAGIDERVVRWFRDRWFHAWAHMEERIKESELNELKRLKAKYEKGIG